MMQHGQEDQLAPAHVDALRAACVGCIACRGEVPENLTAAGLANQLRAHGVDPETLDAATPEQVRRWRRELGFCFVGGEAGAHAFDDAGPARARVEPTAQATATPAAATTAPRRAPRKAKAAPGQGSLF